jgi:crossover junction endodeoxyribonuclease RuvC
MLTIGIDPGTAITGYGLVRENEDGSLTAVQYGVILTGADQTMSQRLASLYQQLGEILNLHQPDYGAVEKLFFARNVRTALSVGQARGVVLLALERQAVPLYEYTPLEVKQSVTGFGGADKNQVQQMVKALLELKEAPQPDDAADALAIAICHLHSRRIQGLLENVELEK